jgi:hypothetical protein
MCYDINDAVRNIKYFTIDYLSSRGVPILFANALHESLLSMSSSASNSTTTRTNSTCDTSTSIWSNTDNLMNSSTNISRGKSQYANTISNNNMSEFSTNEMLSPYNTISSHHQCMDANSYNNAPSSHYQYVDIAPTRGYGGVIPGPGLNMGGYGRYTAQNHEVNPSCTESAFSSSLQSQSTGSGEGSKQKYFFVETSSGGMKKKTKNGFL